METVIEVYQKYLNIVLSKEIEKSSFDLLFENFMGYDNIVDIELNRNKVINDYSLLDQQVQRLLNGEPVQYIINIGWFYGHPFYVDIRVLIPRNETEELIDKIIRKPLHTPVILDICCGSGCLGITYKLAHKDATIYLSDLSKEALEVCNINAKKFNVDVNIIQSDLFTNFKDIPLADVVLCNPPYINKDDPIDTLVWNNEPHMALVPPSGNGLEIYLKIFKEIKNYINDGAILLFEIGFNQKEELANVLPFYFNGSQINFYKDINNNDRILEIIYKKM